MKYHIIALLFMFCILLGAAVADDSLYLYLQCSPGQPCIDLALKDGTTESFLAAPALVLGGADVKSASVKPGVNAPQSLIIELGEAAAGKFEKITGENVGKKIAVVFENKILIAPTIQSPIRGGTLTIYSAQDSFWERAPWLQNLIKGSYRESSQSVTVYVIIAVAVLISIFIFVLLPRMRRNRESSPE
jgi:hypothetical protein